MGQADPGPDLVKAVLPCHLELAIFRLSGSRKTEERVMQVLAHQYREAGLAREPKKSHALLPGRPETETVPDKLPLRAEVSSAGG